MPAACGIDMLSVGLSGPGGAMRSLPPGMDSKMGIGRPSTGGECLERF